MHDEIDAPDSNSIRRRDSQGVQMEAWKRTLEETDEIAEQHRNDGWEVVTVMTAHTDTVSRGMGDDETFGLVHVLPNNYVDEFTAAFDGDEFTEYLAYGTEVDGFMFVVTEFIDPETERSILLPSRYDMALADGMVSSAADAGVLYTHVKTIDGTILGTFEHEEFAPLVSKPNE